MKRHNIKVKDINKLYAAVFRYETEYVKYKKTSTSDTLIPALANFLNEYNIYLARNTKNEISKTKEITGYFLYKEADSQARVFWLYKHIRDAFAHGGIIRSKKKKIVRFQEKQKTLTGELTESQFTVLLQSLPS